jgi:hypothetical protein
MPRATATCPDGCPAWCRRRARGQYTSQNSARGWTPRRAGVQTSALPKEKRLGVAFEMTGYPAEVRQRLRSASFAWGVRFDQWIRKPRPWLDALGDWLPPFR